jgi:hypothetical protein
MTAEFTNEVILFPWPLRNEDVYYSVSLWKAHANNGTWPGAASGSSYSVGKSCFWTTMYVLCSFTCCICSLGTLLFRFQVTPSALVWDAIAVVSVACLH